MSLVFGPVPSRRLGKSLGINNIPPKECTYACIYCQLGNTLKLEIKRRDFYSTKEIIEEVENHLKKIDKYGNQIDYLTFVPDGEPTLDLNLGESISALRRFGIKLAVITNSSLIDDVKVRTNLSKADWVSLKIDTVDEKTWHEINRPHGQLNFKSIINGMEMFSNDFKSFLATETMLIKNINDSDEELEATAKFIKSLNPNKSYISIPTRPPAENNVFAPDAEIINKAYHIFQSFDINVELIIGYEGNKFSATGDFKEDILNITAVHPMRHDAVVELLEKDNAGAEDLDFLLETQQLRKLIYDNKIFYLRNLHKWRKEKEENL